VVQQAQIACKVESAHRFRIRVLRSAALGLLLLCASVATLISTGNLRVLRAGTTGVYVSVFQGRVSGLADWNSANGCAAFEVVRRPSSKSPGVNVIAITVGRQNSIKIGE
jgi:hypothetical protein